MIAVTGATGNVGRVVASELIDAGEDVRVTTRSREKAAQFAGRAEIAVLDFEDRGRLAAAFTGARTAFIGMGTSPQQVDIEKALIDAAVEQGVTHIVKLSVLGAGADFPVVIQEYHTQIERHLASREVAWSILRPATFFQAVTTTPARFIASGAWGGHTAGGRAAFVNTDDVGVFGARIALGDGENKIYDVTGPDSLSMEQVAEVVSAQLGRTVDYAQRSEDEQRQVLTDAGLAPYVVGVSLGLDRMTRDKIMATVSDDFRRVVGRAPGSLTEWLRGADLAALRPAA